jgi:transcriptional regulator with XRE-family HTH domain
MELFLNNLCNQICNMLTRQDIEDFYRDVQRTGLKFKVAAIAKATGYSKGNVSQYLKGRLEPSEAFMKKFYESFPKSSNDAQTSIAAEPRISYGKGDVDTNRIIFNLSESSREHAIADRIRADAEMLREQNNKRMLDLVLTESGSEGSPISSDSRLSGLQTLLIDLGLGKKWKNRDEALRDVHNVLYGSLKPKKAVGNRSS